MRGSELLALACTACALSHEPISAAPDGGVGSGLDSGIEPPSPEPYPFNCEAACAVEPLICTGHDVRGLSCTGQCELLRNTNPAFCEREPVDLLECLRLTPGACECPYGERGCAEQWEAFAPCNAALYDFDCDAACAADPPVCEETPEIQAPCALQCVWLLGGMPGVCDREPLELLECLQVNPEACHYADGSQGCSEEWSAWNRCANG